MKIRITVEAFDRIVEIDEEDWSDNHDFNYEFVTEILASSGHLNVGFEVVEE